MELKVNELKCFKLIEKLIKEAEEEKENKKSI